MRRSVLILFVVFAASLALPAGAHHSPDHPYPPGSPPQSPGPPSPQPTPRRPPDGPPGQQQILSQPGDGEQDQGQDGDGLQVSGGGPTPQTQVAGVQVPGQEFLLSGTSSACAIPARSDGVVELEYVPGDVVVVRGEPGCADPGVSGSGFVESDPVLLARTSVRADGSYEFPPATLPSNLPSGVHTIRVVTTRGGQRVDYTSAITIKGPIVQASLRGTPAGGAGFARLPSSGAAIAALVLAGGALAGGGMWLSSASRRRQTRAGQPVGLLEGIGGHRPSPERAPAIAATSPVVARVSTEIHAWLDE